MAMAYTDADFRRINRGKFTEGQYKALEQLFYELARIGGDLYYYLHFAHNNSNADSETYWMKMGDDSRIYVDAVFPESGKIQLKNILILSHSGHSGKDREQAAIERRFGFPLSKLVEKLNSLPFIEVVGEITVR